MSNSGDSYVHINIPVVKTYHSGTMLNGNSAN